MPFVIAAIILDVAASIWYFSLHDNARGVYWLAAAVLTGVTLRMR